ncbi:MAG: acyl CoA:acetate/3-ketoacid CoA transferase [Gammaproteobacteria bacterium]|nr:MAG: acyl CoA:acetate/3-ketoacid CoA transferase [Gammaproteobacteria bacterium]
MITALQAVEKIKDNDTIITGGFVGTGVAEELMIALEKRFLEQNQPRDLTLVYAAGQGDSKDRGGNHLAHEGLIKRVIGGHWGLVPKLQKLAFEEKLEAYNLPQGVIAHMLRDIAGKKPATLSTVGLDTFVDPRVEGGKVNKKAKEDIVELFEIDGKECLRFKQFKPSVALIRGTTADTRGNITFEKEALKIEAMAIAAATTNSGGVVIAQVENVVDAGELRPHSVVVPGVMVDYIVKASVENHQQTFGSEFDPAFVGEVACEHHDLDPLPMSVKKIMGRRACFELQNGDIVNLGIGAPEAVAMVAAEEGVIDNFTLTAEPGVIGGVPAGGLDFGASYNPEAIIDQPYQFDFYDGGGLCIAYLGMAQLDMEGNVNVSKFSGRVAGAGGFINISQNTHKVVFMGAMLSGKIEFTSCYGEMKLEKNSGGRKFVDKVEQITFSGKRAIENGQDILYVTERCVFRLVKEGVELIEIAPGVDLHQDILEQMDFKPLISPDLKLMDPRIFAEEKMGIKN